MLDVTRGEEFAVKIKNFPQRRKIHQKLPHTIEVKEMLFYTSFKTTEGKKETTVCLK
jgi:hypothetical protein